MKTSQDVVASSLDKPELKPCSAAATGTWVSGGLSLQWLGRWKAVKQVRCLSEEINVVHVRRHTGDSGKRLLSHARVAV